MRDNLAFYSAQGHVTKTIDSADKHNTVVYMYLSAQAKRKWSAFPL